MTKISKNQRNYERVPKKKDKIFLEEKTYMLGLKEWNEI